MDRCSPKKALEVLESVKVFLGIDGFVYVMGLSHETIAKLISAEYEKSGVKGEQYIKKIIQIPIVIQQWNIEDVKKLLQDLLDSEVIPTKYRDIANNKDSIAKAIEHNPREVKRFINNFIVAYDIHGSDKQVDPAVLLILQAISVRWGSFYRLIMDSTKELRSDIDRYSQMNEEQRARTWFEAGQQAYIPEQDRFDEESRRVLADFKLDHELWHFIRENGRAIFGINDWTVYRRVAEAVKEDYSRISVEPGETETPLDVLYGFLDVIGFFSAGAISRAQFIRRLNTFTVEMERSFKGLKSHSESGFDEMKDVLESLNLSLDALTELESLGLTGKEYKLKKDKLKKDISTQTLLLRDLLKRAIGWLQSESMK